ncbi:hypothetical protein Riv7116_5083 [Rivularia sp. PCC 7116]|uniref:hypothetical protein n=1 Tax=Rivularia sp. PCC 7116 TaxID=373994 RepID=UPI00029EFD37|nr:hypothetical protein [Rivularia sp. PCC 7116]AFY57481.1 hypothetical protein Riv7116_5083 [Rivularia sp. PCC 7116]
MKIQALDIRPGDRIIAYFNNKMQVCTVKNVSNPDRTNITLSVFVGERYRHSSSGTIRFKPEALLELTDKFIKQEPGLAIETVNGT